MRWSRDDLIRRVDDVLAVYGEAMQYDIAMIRSRRGYIVSHAHQRGFRAVATIGTDGQLAGFGYGYQSAPGQWWHSQVRHGLGPAERSQWLTDCFEVVELHVRPAVQGHGLGEHQLRALLHQTPGQTVLLSTPEADEQQSRAWRLYRRTGFVDVLRHFSFPGDIRRFAILGRTLPVEP